MTGASGILAWLAPRAVPGVEVVRPDGYRRALPGPRVATVAVVDDEAYPEADDVVGRDLWPDLNPGAEEHVPDEITVPDDKQQEPDEDSGSEDTPEEPPA